MSTTLTRRQLYDLVWSKPMRDLAVEFGISDVGLAKICKRHRVPTPPRGYWAKIQAGRKAKRSIFVENKEPGFDLIEIRSYLTSVPERARDAVERAKVARAESKKTTDAQSSSSEVAATRRLADLRQSVRPTARELRKAKADTSGGVSAVGEGMCGVEVAKGSVERAIAFLDSLARALEAKGLLIQPSGKVTKVVLGPDKIEFSLKEQSRWQAHVPTARELVMEEQRKKRMSRMDFSWSSSFGTTAYPKQELIYTGLLAFQVEGYSDGVRRRWADGKKQRVEALLKDIVIGIEALMAVRKAQREDREEWERQWQEKERRRELQRKRAELEDQRKKFLLSVLDLFSEIDRIERWLSGTTEITSSPHNNYRRLIDWSNRRLANLKATISFDNIEDNLVRNKMFSEQGQPEDLDEEENQTD